MPAPIVLSDEQFEMLRRVEAETARLNDSPRLRDDPDAIRSATALLDLAEKIGLPNVSLVDLRNLLNRFGRNGDGGTSGVRP